jgi:hypothetical protein
MVERSLERFDLYPSGLLGDSGYGSAELLGWLVYEHGIEPHVTVFDRSGGLPIKDSAIDPDQKQGPRPPLNS